MAVYNHFDGKASLLMAAARRELARLDDRVGANHERRTPAERARITIAAFLAPEATSSRRFFAELNCVAHRHPDLEALLDEWKYERESWWAADAGSSKSAAAVSKAYQLLLLGACQLDTYGNLSAPPEEVVSLLQEAAAQLFR
jgi:AcrR family transcriptional regulator